MIWKLMSADRSLDRWSQIKYSRRLNNLGIGIIPNLVPCRLIGNRYIYLMTTFLIRIILIDHHLKIVPQSFLSLDKWRFCCCFLFDMSNSSWIIMPQIHSAAVVTKKLSSLLRPQKVEGNVFDVVANTYLMSLVSLVFLIDHSW